MIERTRLRRKTNPPLVADAATSDVPEDSDITGVSAVVPYESRDTTTDTVPVDAPAVPVAVAPVDADTIVPVDTDSIVAPVVTVVTDASDNPPDDDSNQLLRGPFSMETRKPKSGRAGESYLLHGTPRKY